LGETLRFQKMEILFPDVWGIIPANATYAVFVAEIRVHARYTDDWSVSHYAYQKGCPNTLLRIDPSDRAVAPFPGTFLTIPL
jgi:hypothetical protein